MGGYGWGDANEPTNEPFDLSPYLTVTHNVRFQLVNHLSKSCLQADKSSLVLRPTYLVNTVWEQDLVNTVWEQDLVNTV